VSCTIQLGSVQYNKCHQKKKGDDFYCKNPWHWVYKFNRICWNLLKQKEGYYKCYFYIQILTNIKFCYSSSMDFKGSDLSWFPFNEPTSYLMSVATHTSTKEIPQLQSQHHYLIPLWNCTKTQNKINGCYFVHFLISYCSNLRSSLWGDFLSLYSRFYEVTILENTYVTTEGKMQVYF